MVVVIIIDKIIEATTAMTTEVSQYATEIHVIVVVKHLCTYVCHSQRMQKIRKTKIKVLQMPVYLIQIK